jgi:predicted dehydrogenase
MIDAAKRNQVILMEAMRSTQTPNFKAVKNHLHRIGKVRRYCGIFCQYSSRYDAYKEGVILNAFKPELSNGSLMDIGVYCIHPMISLFGKPLGIKANAIMLESGVDGEGCLVCTYEEMEGIAIFSKITNSRLPSEIQGEEGNILIEHMVDFDRVKIVFRDGTEEEISHIQRKDTMYYEINEFINLVIKRDFETQDYLLRISQEVMECMDEARRQIGLVFLADKV